VISPTQRPLTDNTYRTDTHTLVEFESTIPASKRMQTHALDARPLRLAKHYTVLTPNRTTFNRRCIGLHLGISNNILYLESKGNPTCSHTLLFLRLGKENCSVLFMTGSSLFKWLIVEGHQQVLIFMIMTIRTLCKTTDRSGKRKNFWGEWRGKKQMNTADVFFGHQTWKC
jgi:hypothetical protein